MFLGQIVKLNTDPKINLKEDIYNNFQLNFEYPDLKAIFLHDLFFKITPQPIHVSILQKEMSIVISALRSKYKKSFSSYLVFWNMS